MGNDLVYGTGRKSDVLTQAGQVVHKPMYELAIFSFDEDMKQSGAYQMDGYYIEGTQLWKKGIFKKEENAYRFDNWKKEFSRLEEEYYRLSEKGIRFITPLDADYPKRLYSVYDYPMGLYIKGELPAEDRATAAVIGLPTASV